MKSIIITKNINTYFVIQRIKMALNNFESEYQLSDYFGKCYVCWREWLSKEDYLKGISEEEVDNIVNKVLIEDMPLPYRDNIKKKELSKIIDVSKFENIISSLSKYDSIDNLNSIRKIEEKALKFEAGYVEEGDVLAGDKIWVEANENLYRNLTNYIKLFNNNNKNVQIKDVFFFTETLKEVEMGETLLFLFEKDIADKEDSLCIDSQDSKESKENKESQESQEKTERIERKERIICQTDYETWESVIEYWDSIKYPYRRWMDSWISCENGTEKFSRLIDEYKIYITNGQIEYIDRLYNFSDINWAYRDKKYNGKIGTLDLETLTLKKGQKDSTVGEQSVYAGGWALNELGSKTFIIDKIKIKDSSELIENMFEELFKLKVNGYTLYAHNLGRFDAIFLIKLLALLDYQISPIWKDNAILRIKIFDPKTKQRITLLDSLNLLKTYLKKLLISFNCETRKGEFPHLFVEEDNLNYIGNKPDIKYYSLSNISLDEYNQINSSNWNLKEECLNYLEKDILGLLEVLNKVSLYYFKEFGVNIPKYLTLPSLAMSVFGFNFYDEKYKIKMIKGPLEKFIREAYFGGNVGVYNQETKGRVNRAYHYDMNSQYPNAMLNKLPTGNPVFSTNKDLSYYFGFVYALITPPSISELKNLYIQSRTELGKVVCPRTPFYRWIASFELESALKDNYKAEILYGINFPNSSEVYSSKLFEKYVTHFYDKKKNAKDTIERNVAKLMLNSLYGKFGQKDIENSIKIVSREDANRLIKSHHVSYFAQINKDKILIKYSSRLNEKLRRIYSQEDNLNQLETKI